MFIYHNSKHYDIDLARGLACGFIASFLSSIFIGFTTITSLKPNFYIFSTYGKLFGLDSGVIIGWAIYFTIGTFIWGPFYALIHSSLPKYSVISKGLAFGLIRWALEMLIIAPIAKAGFFAINYGSIVAGSILILDLIFGLVVAGAYSDSSERKTVIF